MCLDINLNCEMQLIPDNKKARKNELIYLKSFHGHQEV